MIQTQTRPNQQEQDMILIQTIPLHREGAKDMILTQITLPRGDRDMIPILMFRRQDKNGTIQNQIIHLKGGNKRTPIRVEINNMTLILIIPRPDGLDRILILIYLPRGEKHMILNQIPITLHLGGN